MDILMSMLHSKGVTFNTPEDRLEVLGPSLMQWEQYEYNMQQFFKNDLLVYPWTVTTRQVFPSLAVALVSFYYHPLEVELEYYLDLQTVAITGLQPLQLGTVGEEIDMVWMCEQQAETFWISVFDTPENGRWVSLDFHLQYFFDVIYGIRGYEDSDGKIHKVATCITTAELWRKAIMDEGLRKAKMLLSPDKMAQYSDQMMYIEANVKPSEDDNIIDDLAAKL